MSEGYEGQQQPESDQGGSAKRQKSRHRASVACSQCRERRIRVCSNTSVQFEGQDLITCSVLYPRETTSACSVSEQDKTV